MIESPRKHGPFDRRYPAVANVATAAPEGVPAGDARLDWSAYSARFFPGTGRHDLEAIAAYAAYSRTRPAAAGTTVQPRTAPPTPGVLAWEWEGGAIVRNRRRTTGAAPRRARRANTSVPRATR